MRKILLLAVVSVFLFSGCALYQEAREIRGVNINLGINGNGVTVPIGDGWLYTNTMNVSNGIPGAVIDIFQDGIFIARVNEGGTLSVRFKSFRCYGGWGYSYNYPGWDSVPPEQSLHASVYKDGKFIFSRDWKIRLHDCYRGIRQSDDWNIQ